ncbi:MAG: serine dehydratase subunit alpha family protein [Anaerolineaceae bacterium]|nr:serine dehydratase subunit alpha family protein [Anaerolineaceae bacterium]
MENPKTYYPTFTNILKSELLTALGCTEPICIAYCSAVMRRTLGAEPEKIRVYCSGNLIKNAKGATVPNSGGLRGIAASAVLGAVGGDPSKQLELLTDITPEQIEHAKTLLSKNICEELLLENEEDKLQVIVRGEARAHVAEAELKYTHTNICRVELDGKPVPFRSFCEGLSVSGIPQDDESGYSDLTVRRIIDYAENADLDAEDIRDTIRLQIRCNRAISEEGLNNDWGASVGKIILRRGSSLPLQAVAAAAAGSDARMSGCELPVVINSGSGNQGITVTMPVVKYAEELKKTEDELIRALMLANLVAIHIKSSYGRLSAFCGAVSAATGAGAAITWLSGGNYAQICGTITNTLGTISGMVCDGAKPSCAAKIASAVDTAILAHEMAMAKKQFHSGDGLIKENIEATIRSVGRMAAEGMVETDQKILELMMEKDEEHSS